MGKLLVIIILLMGRQISLDGQKFVGEDQICNTIKTRMLRVDLVFNGNEYELKRTYIDSQLKKNESILFKGNYVIHSDTIMLESKLRYGYEDCILLNKQNSMVVLGSSEFNFYKGLKIKEIKKTW